MVEITNNENNTEIKDSENVEPDIAVPQDSGKQAVDANETLQFSELVQASNTADSEIVATNSSVVIEFEAIDQEGNADEDGAPTSQQQHADANETTEVTEQEQEKSRLNQAYESLEKMRLFNLELQCGEAGVVFHPDECTQCLYVPKPTASEQLSRFPRIASLVADKSNFPRLRKLADHTKKSRMLRCLVCNAPVCRQHAKRTGEITLCPGCDNLLSLDLIVDCLTASEASVRQSYVDRIIDAYDRVLLLLKYSLPLLDSVASTLEESKYINNQVGVGSSSVGLVSGALGIAAAATLLTPAGPPLLIASLVMGGSATAAQVGTDVVQSRSEATKMAVRVASLHSIMGQLLNVVGVLRDAMVRDHIRSDQYDKQNDEVPAWLKDPKSWSTTASVLGVTAGRYSIGIETGILNAGRQARFGARTGTNLMRTARFARVAGGALSAAVFVLEAKSLHSTVTQIQEGSPCETAKKIREIEEAIRSGNVPDSREIDSECQTYLRAMEARRRALTQKEVAEILMEQSRAAQEEAAQLEQLQLNTQDDASTISNMTGNSLASRWEKLDLFGRNEGTSASQEKSAVGSEDTTEVAGNVAAADTDPMMQSVILDNTTSPSDDLDDFEVIEK